MKILMIGTGIPTIDMRGIGGAGMAVVKIAESLAKTEQVFIIPRWSERPTILKKNFKINGVEYIRRRVSLELIILILKYIVLVNFKAIMKYTNGMNKIKYSILYVFDRALTELVFKQIKIDIIHVHGLGLDHLPFIDAAIEMKIPFVCTSHGSNAFNSDIHLDFDKIYEKDIITRVSSIDNAAITTVSMGVKELFVKNYHIPSNKIMVILNGVDNEIFSCSKKTKKELRMQYSLPQDDIILLQVGSLTRLKNHIAVLKAIVEMDDNVKNKLSYLIVGEGDEKRNLMKYIHDNSLVDRVFFMGYLPPNGNLVDMYHLSDLFILPSTSEGMPLVFFEAMAAGLPIITFKDLQGVVDIYDTNCMELMLSRDTTTIVSAIKIALGRQWNKEIIKERCRNWRWDSISEKYRLLYQVLMGVQGVKK